jgi:hypothetical protein
MQLVKLYSFAFRLLIVLLFCSGHAFCQQLQFKGKVTDANTGEELPVVNIYYKGSSIGTTTDFHGNYSLKTAIRKDSIYASFVGYQTQAKKISGDSVQIINFALKPSAVLMNELIVTADRDDINPAIPFMKKVVEHKAVNDPNNLKAYQYEVYSKIELDLNNIDEKLKDKKVMRHFGFMFDQQVPGDTVSKPYVPILLAENLSDYYYQKDPRKEKEIIRASRVSGVKNESVTEQLASTNLKVNIYDNYINIFNKGFISPLANTGKLFYHYYIMDSTMKDSTVTSYKITFVPKMEHDLAFTGDMWIMTDSYAVVKAYLKLSPKANLNWINTIIMEQEFAKKDSIYMMNKEFLLIDFGLAKNSDKSGFYARKNSTYQNIVFNKSYDEVFYEKPLIVEEEARTRDDQYWDANRHDTLSRHEKMIYKNVERIQKIPFFMSMRDLAATILNGYQSVGFVEFGPYLKLVTYNPIEGVRARLGMRTNANFSRSLRLELYGAYGFYDDRVKYGAGAMYLFNKDPRRAVGVRYKDDIEQIGQSESAYDVDHVLGSLLKRNPLDKLSMTHELETYYEHEWVRGFQNTGSLIYKRYYPNKYDDFSRYGGSFNTSAVRLGTRIAPGEKVIIGDFDRIVLSSKKPVFRINYEYGFKSSIGDFEYHSASADMKHQFNVGALGYSKYFISFGKTWGTLPYVMLNVLPGNDNYTFDHQSYNLMNYYEFVCDRYVSIYYTHYFEGLFLNRIPLLKKLQLRELIWGKSLWSEISDDHQSIQPFPSFLQGLKTPYYEAGFGIENIAKALRLDFFWRFTHLDKPDASPFGIRGSLQIKF